MFVSRCKLRTCVCVRACVRTITAIKIFIKIRRLHGMENEKCVGSNVCLVRVSLSSRSLRLVFFVNGEGVRRYKKQRVTACSLPWGKYENTTLCLFPNLVTARWFQHGIHCEGFCLLQSTKFFGFFFKRLSFKLTSSQWARTSLESKKGAALHCGSLEMHFTTYMSLLLNVCL